jgi:hypothetical protein
MTSLHREEIARASNTAKDMELDISSCKVHGGSVQPIRHEASEVETLKSMSTL